MQNTYTANKYDPRTTAKYLFPTPTKLARHIRSQITTTGNWRGVSKFLGHTLRGNNGQQERV